MIYLIALLMGFIISVWYSSLLGSFLTTNLYTTQIRSLEDMRKTNMKIVFPYEKAVMESLAKYEDCKDMAISVKLEEQYELFNNFNRSYAFLFFKSSFEYTFVPPIGYFESDVIVEYNFLSINIYNTIYKNSLDKLINIVLDTGLYEYWNRAHDILGAKIRKRRIIIFGNILRIITMNFYFYLYFLLLIGFFLSIVMFLMEKFIKI